MKKTQLNWGFLGAAKIGQSLAPAIVASKYARAYAVASRNREKAEAYAHDYGFERSYGSYQALLKDPNVDVIYNPLPNHLHCEWTIRALEAGKHVLCERPLARSAKEAADMAKAAKKADCHLLCTVQHRFRPDAQLLKKFVDKGDLGEIFFAKAGWLRQRTDWDSDEWRQQKRESGGGVVLDLGFQMLDLALWVLGGARAESVSASVHRMRKDEVEDSATTLLRLDNGTTLTLELTWGLLMEKDFMYLNLFGSGGAALLNPFRVHKGMHGSLVNVTPTLEPSRHQYKAAIEAQMAHFADVLRKGVKPMGAADEILPVMELLDGIYRSAEQGKEVRLG